MAVEPHFIKSVLPVQDLLLSLEANDTSLAVPTEEKINKSRNLFTERNLRVQQQVQHTLARKGRTSIHSSPHVTSSQSLSSTYGMPNGGSQKHIHSTLGRIVSCDGGHTLSFRPAPICSPQRVEVSPDSSPVVPHPNLGLRTQHHSLGSIWVNSSSFTIPPTVQSPRLCPQHSRRYAHSEGMRGEGRQRWHSTLHGAVNRPPNQLISQPRSTGPTHGTTLNETSFTTYRTAEAQRVAGGVNRPSYMVQGVNQVETTGGQDAGDLAWLGQLRQESQRSGKFRRDSYQASEVSMEVDTEIRRQASGMQAQQQIATTDRKAEGQGTMMTVEKAISLLEQNSVDKQLSAANFLQHQCFNSAESKRKVCYLQGIPKLIALLESDSEELLQAAAGALRNVVFESNHNKMEVWDCEGIPAIVHVLQSSRDLETRRQLTGLLWNLSSHDQLKEYLLRKALKTLTDSVLVPCSGINEGENPKDDLLVDMEVFYNATGCLRNLSSAGPDGRQAMREKTGLIDALVYYIRGTIADYQPDDKSTENCVCILHNLSYQLEAELPQEYSADFRESRDAAVIKTKSPGCFPVRNTEFEEHLESQRPLLEDKSNPNGAEWLWSAITARMYLSLIARSNRRCTQEASVGALQNLTAGSGPIAETLAHVIVQREGGLSQLKGLLETGEVDLRKITVSLLRNLSRFRGLHGDITSQLLAELVAMLPSSDTSANLPADTTVSLCHILINLCQAGTEGVRAVVNHGALPKVISLSTIDNGYGPSRTAQAACILLHTMWSHPDLRGAYKRAGYRKSDFINNRTQKALPTRD